MQTSPQLFPALQLFIDGSFDPGSRTGGWGIVVFRSGVKIFEASGTIEKTDSGATEVTAMLNALIWHGQHAPSEPALIWSDSIYVVNGCEKWRHIWRNAGWKRRSANGKGRNRTVPNSELWREIDQHLNANPSISIRWCKGHSAISGNEFADELANRARQSKI